jgi:hypothetical protein
MDKKMAKPDRARFMNVLSLRVEAERPANI